jgi:oxalate decarboxylase/phosphoglucose isomerase-like protein (cupin superfamily)
VEDVKILKLSEVESRLLPGADSEDGGWMKRIVCPDNVNTKRTVMGLSEVNPGYSPHRWHNHTGDRAGGYEIVYPKNFEEVYHIVRGRGVVQWKTQDGQLREEKVEEGDTIFFPPGVGEHQVFNNGPGKMVVLFCGSPIPVHKKMD